MSEVSAKRWRDDVSYKRVSFSRVTGHLLFNNEARYYYGLKNRIPGCTDNYTRNQRCEIYPPIWQEMRGNYV